MFHPGLRLLLWTAVIVLLQLAAPAFMLMASLACVIAAGLFSAARFVRLLSRSVWLLAALAVFFAWGSAGLYLFPELGALGPTREGVQLAAVHVMRLVAIIALVSLLVARTPAEDIVAGLHALLAPFGRVRETLAVRLTLVLRNVEDGNTGWREWLAPAACEPQVIRLRAPARPGRADLAAAAAVAGVALACWLL